MTRAITHETIRDPGPGGCVVAAAPSGRAEIGTVGAIVSDCTIDWATCTRIITEMDS